MTARSAYKLLEKPGADSFAEAWDKAAEQGRDRARDSIIERAMHGAMEPVFRRGRQVGTRRRYYDRLAIAVTTGQGSIAGATRAEVAKCNRRRRESLEAEALAEAAAREEQAAYDADLAVAMERGRRIEEQRRREAESRVPRVRLL